MASLSVLENKALSIIWLIISTFFLLALLLPTFRLIIHLWHLHCFSAEHRGVHECATDHISMLTKMLVTITVSFTFIACLAYWFTDLDYLSAQSVVSIRFCEGVLTMAGLTYVLAKTLLYVYFIIRSYETFACTDISYKLRHIQILIAITLSISISIATAASIIGADIVETEITAWGTIHCTPASEGSKYETLTYLVVLLGVLDIIYAIGTVWMLVGKLFAFVRMSVRTRAQTIGLSSVTSDSNITTPARTNNSDPTVKTSIPLSLNPIKEDQTDKKQDVLVMGPASKAQKEMELAITLSPVGTSPRKPKKGDFPPDTIVLGSPSAKSERELAAEDDAPAKRPSFLRQPSESAPSRGSKLNTEKAMSTFHNATKDENSIILLAVKLVILLFISLLSSLISAFFLTILSVGGTPQIIDLTVNLYCLWLSFSFSTEQFNQLTCNSSCVACLFPWAKMAALTWTCCHNSIQVGGKTYRRDCFCGCGCCGDEQKKTEQWMIRVMADREYRIYVSRKDAQRNRNTTNSNENRTTIDSSEHTHPSQL